MANESNYGNKDPRSINLPILNNKCESGNIVVLYSDGHKYSSEFTLSPANVNNLFVPMEINSSRNNEHYSVPISEKVSQLTYFK